MSKEAERLVEEFSEDLALILQTFIDETKDAKIVIARIENEIKRLKEDISGLNKIIRDGNGQPPLITRIAVLEEKISELKSHIESIEAESTGKSDRFSKCPKPRYSANRQLLSITCSRFSGIFTR